MAIKKSELYSSLWASCDELRGGMDASQYKDYVLVLLFVKYVSDKFAGQPYAPITIPTGASFKDMVALKGKSDIGDQINKKILGPLSIENNLSDMPDFNDSNKLGSGKEMVDRLTNLIAIFENPALDFSKNRADGDDLLGDAYEYLMRHFATESGKSKGQFYTPAEVSRVIAQTLGLRHAATTNDTTVYDPTCGSGSLLLKIGDEASHGKEVRVTLYGQEKDSSTAGLARMNMILHDYATAVIKQGNTIANPLFTEGDTLNTFDYVVANPPFSDKRWSTGLDPEHDPFYRFQHYGIPPARQGDYAYLLHILRSLKSTGKGACILPHGVLFRGNAEGVIRRKLVQRGVIKGIIGLPANLFYGTGIPACIIVLDKEQAQARKGIFMIDASKGFRKDGNKNRLREQDIHRIVDTFTRQVEIPGYARMVPVAEISDAKNDYNLNLPRYIDSTEAADLHDINAHLRGGIPDRDIDALSRYWQVIPGVRAALFAESDHPGYCKLRVAATDIKTAIFDHPEFTAFNGSATTLFAKWKSANTPRLKGFGKDGHPKALIETLSEDLLATFEAAPLLDPYDIYQHLMDYWAETMQDDCYLIAGDGWCEAAKPRLILDDKTKKTRARPDFTRGKQRYQAELIPPALIIARYFATEQAEIEALEMQISALQQQMEEMAEEHSGEDGLLEEAKNDKEKLTRASITARIREVKTDPEAEDEYRVLSAYLALIDKDGDMRAKVKEAEEALIEKVAAQYGKLAEDEIKTLVIDDKWLATLAAAVQGELARVSQTLTSRIRQLAERYATPLPQLTCEAAILAARVDGTPQEDGRLMELKPGYTQTEVGVIPEEWEVKTIDEVGFVTSGKRLPLGCSLVEHQTPHPYVRVADMRPGTVSLSEIKFVPESVFPAIKRYRIFCEDIFISVAGTLGIVGKVPKELDGANLTENADRITNIKCSQDYLLHVLMSPLIQNTIDSIQTVGAQPKLALTRIRKFAIPIPPPQEQCAIVTVISDMDAEIERLEQRREKTRALKQAMMQELLTGRTRLI